MTTPLLRVDALHKQFVLHLLGGKRVLAFADVSFQAAPGAFLGIAGPSGSGKSSLIKCLYRTYLVDSGAILYRRADGTTIDLATARDDDVLDLRVTEISYVSQFLRPAPRVRALDLAMRPLLQRGVPADDARDRVTDLFTRLRLPRELWDGYPILFSGGEQQRVNLVRALAARPRLLLLDEPTSALDESLQQEVVALLTEARQQGATIIGIMHDLALLHRIADEVMTMAHGRVTSIAAAR